MTCRKREKNTHMMHKRKRDTEVITISVATGKSSSRVKETQEVNGQLNKNPTTRKDCYVLLSPLNLSASLELNHSKVSKELSIIEEGNKQLKRRKPVVKECCDIGKSVRPQLSERLRSNVDSQSSEIIKKAKVNVNLVKQLSTSRTVPQFPDKPIKKTRTLGNNQVLSENISKEITLTNSKYLKSAVKKKIASPAKKLRKRNFVNYAESSVETTKIEGTPVSTKIPIYKQPDAGSTHLGRQENVYEFDSDSEKYKKRKRRKDNNSSYDEYNKTIQEILKNIVNKKEMKKRVVIANKTIKGNHLQKSSKAVARSQGSNNKIVCIKQGSNAVEGKLGGHNDETDVPDDNNRIVKSNRNIKILSNIQLMPSQELRISVIHSPTKFCEVAPDANSTMVNNVFTPWRFNEINIKRNPHFITLKHSSLPSLNQEMVLDHTIDDKLRDISIAKNERSPQDGISSIHNKTPLQTRVTDYFDGTTEDKENVAGSLFDNDLFSPVKSKNSFASKINTVKRKILGEKNDNLILQSTPRSEIDVPDMQKNEELTYFGFESDAEDSTVASTLMRKEDKPFRFSVKFGNKQYYPSRQKRQLPQIEESRLVTSDEESNISGSENEDVGREIGLFEDIANEDEIKVPKTRKLKWMKDDKDVQHYKRRKDIRTKEEERAAEEWAAAFNFMCDEIEDFPLEIE